MKIKAILYAVKFKYYLFSQIEQKLRTTVCGGSGYNFNLQKEKCFLVNWSNYPNYTVGFQRIVRGSAMELIWTILLIPKDF